MTTASQLISKQIKINQPKVEEIARLQKQIESSENRLDRKLVNHYIDSGEILDSETLLETIGFDRVKKIIANIFKKSTLNKESLLQPEILRIIECFSDKETKKVEDNIQKSFEELSIAEKITFSLFCSGRIALYQKFTFLEKFLSETFDLKEYSKDGESILKISGYNYENYQGVLQVAMKKDDTEGSQRIAKTIFDILSTGAYLSDIDVFESTLSYHDNIYMELKREGDTITPIVHKGRYDQFTSEKESLLEMLTECVEYISKRHPYYGIEEEEEEEDGFF